MCFLLSRPFNRVKNGYYITRCFSLVLVLFFTLALDPYFHQLRMANAAISMGAGAVGQRADHDGKNIFYTDKFAVLIYHHISQEEGPYTISPARFTEQVDTLKKLGYNFISLNQATDFLEGREKIPANALVITFDDGYDSFYRHAYPILKQRAMPATMFVIVRYVGGGDGDTRRLSWQQMQEMQKDGFTFYSHTYNSHYYVTVDANGTQKPALADLAYREDRGKETWAEFGLRVEGDLQRAKEELEANLGRQVEYLALPFGLANKKTIDIAQKLGHKYILTTKPGLNGYGTPANDLFRFNAGSPNKDGNRIHQEISKASGYSIRAAEIMFSDVLSNHWAGSYIINLANRAVVSGYPDGSFRPDEKVTRAEFVVMLGKAMGWELPASTTTPSFSDVGQNIWAWRFIDVARARGVAGGYHDNTFRPNDFITRAEIAKIMAGVLDLLAGSSGLTDINASWAKDYINVCVEAGIVLGYPDSTFRPNGPATRAEAAKMIVGLGDARSER